MTTTATTIAKQPMDLKLELVIIPVSDVDRAKAFYEKLGWRFDGDFDGGEKLRVVQFTPPRSETSIIFGKGITMTKPGSAEGLVLAVHRVDAARDELISRGAKVSEIFHYDGLPFNNSVDNARVNGRDPEGRSYFTFASFADPDGNEWLLQEITMRFPNREWEQNQAGRVDVATIAELLHETSEHHDHYEKTHAEHHWWDWYASYFNARQNGNDSKEAATVADRYMDEVFHIPRR
jgi:catechol 2,3-dioxygenase-like lactoylglutathione lyase family enzyme